MSDQVTVTTPDSDAGAAFAAGAAVAEASQAADDAAAAEVKADVAEAIADAASNEATQAAAVAVSASDQATGAQIEAEAAGQTAIAAHQRIDGLDEKLSLILAAVQPAESATTVEPPEQKTEGDKTPPKKTRQEKHTAAFWGGLRK